MLNIDIDATGERKFKDPDSRILLDGREILQGEDWLIRKMELWDKCKGQCEFMIAPGIRCLRVAADPHHIKPRGSNGVDRDDRLENLRGLCRRHHQLVDRRKVQWTQWIEDANIPF
jgi:hypothetical protein